jgi:hypothetical protein
MPDKIAPDRALNSLQPPCIENSVPLGSSEFSTTESATVYQRYIKKCISCPTKDRSNDTFHIPKTLVMMSISANQLSRME